MTTLAEAKKTLEVLKQKPFYCQLSLSEKIVYEMGYLAGLLDAERPTEEPIL